MPPRLKMVLHYDTQILEPLHNFLNLFLNHHSGCSKFSSLTYYSFYDQGNSFDVQIVTMIV